MEMRAVYAECLAKFMEEDKHVVVLDADLAKASGTRKLYEQFPEQMFDCGVAEQDMASIAAGLSSYGFKPWIESFTPFATRRICDQIAISISYAKQNVKIVGTDPGISAELNGGTHMSMEDIGVVRSIPGVVIFEPVDETQLRAAMPVLNDYYGPVYMRLFRKVTPDVFSPDYKFDLFKADTLREGKDLSIFVSGMFTSVHLCLRHVHPRRRRRRRRACKRGHQLRRHQRPYDQAHRPRDRHRLRPQDRHRSDRGKPQRHRRSALRRMRGSRS